MLDVSPNSNRNQFRRQRILMLRNLIEAVLLEKPSCKVIDIGGTRGFWDTWKDLLDFSKVSITCVNSDTAHADYGDQNSAIIMRKGDARDLSFAADKEYDIAFSNSVIE